VKELLDNGDNAPAWFLRFIITAFFGWLIMGGLTPNPIATKVSEVDVEMVNCKDVVIGVYDKTVIYTSSDYETYNSFKDIDICKFKKITTYNMYGGKLIDKFKQLPSHE